MKNSAAQGLGEVFGLVATCMVMEQYNKMLMRSQKLELNSLCSLLSKNIDCFPSLSPRLIAAQRNSLKTLVYIYDSVSVCSLPG